MNRSGDAARRALALSVSLLAAIGSALAQAPSPSAAPHVRYGAVVDVKAFTYRRDIAPGVEGLVQLSLDAAVLAHSRRNFADLRVVAPDGRQVPYLVQKDNEREMVRLPPLERETSNRDRRDRDDSRASVSRYTVRLPYPGLPSAQLVLQTKARVFERVVRVEVLPANDGTPHPETICRVLWSHADPESDAEPLTVDVSSLRSTALSLAVDEGDNAPLPLAPPTLLLPAYRLRFVRPANVPLQLVYGNDEIDAPRYDVALEPGPLLDAAAVAVTAAPERDVASRPIVTGLVFWVALGAAVVVLALLIARLLRTDRA